MMGAWGPRTPEQHKEAQERARKWEAEEPWRKKVKKLEAHIAKQDHIINLLKKHLMSLGDGFLSHDLVIDLLEALTEE